MPARNVYILLIVVVTSLFVASKTTLKEQIFRNVAREIEKRSLEAPTSDRLFEGALTGMADAVGDAPYTAYLPPAEKTEYMREIQGRFAGIGIRNLVKDAKSGEFYFVPMRGTPAANAGLKLGDRIAAVDGESVETSTIFELTEKLRGDAKTTVSLKVRPRATVPEYASALESGDSNVDDPDKPADADGSTAPDVFREVELTREEIQQDVVSGDRIGADGNWIYTLKDYPQIGYVAIEQFADSTAAQTIAALDALTKAGVESIILDFRGNPGGFLPDAVAICDEFVPAGGPIVETRNRDGKTDRAFLATDRPKKSPKLVVLIDRDSASASEIVSACLQDSRLAIVCGERSYGKGTIQSLFELPCDLGVLRMTTAGFWRPSGKPIHRRRDATDADVWGVSPDPGFAVELETADRFYRTWIRSLRVSAPEASALDDRALAFVKNRTRKALRQIASADELAKLEAAAELGFELDELKDAVGKLRDESTTTAFEPKGRAPYFDPQLDRAVDYLTGAFEAPKPTSEPNAEQTPEPKDESQPSESRVE